MIHQNQTSKIVMDDSKTLIPGAPEKKPKRPAAAKRPPREPKCPRFDRFCRGAENDWQPADEIEENFRHGHWRARRVKVMAALARSGTGRVTCQHFACCGSDAMVQWSPKLKKHRISANYCKNRHCEPCMRAKAGKIAGNLRRRLEEGNHLSYRFLTLTLKHSKSALGDQIKRLYRAFRKMRSMDLWKINQRGGVFAVEVKWDARSREWHPHLHVICEGDHMSRERLSAAWLACTGDSFVVDIRILASGRDAAHYVSKYVAKGTSGEVWDDLDAASEWITATRGLRMCASFGSWRGLKLTAKSEDPGDWVSVGFLNQITTKAIAGEIWARGVLENLRPPGATDSS